MTIDEVLAYVEPCTYVTDGEWNPDSGWSLTYCLRPSVDDEEEPRCAEHLGLVS